MIIHNAMPAREGENLSGFVNVKCECEKNLLVPIELKKEHIMECTFCRRRFRDDEQKTPKELEDSRKKTSEIGKNDKKNWRIFQWLQILIDKLKPTK